MARRSIKTSLFLANAAIVALTVAAAVSYNAIWGSGRLRADMLDRLEERAAATRDGIDDCLQKMDSASISVLYSQLVKERFVAYASDPPRPDRSTPGTRDDPLMEVLFAIIGPTMPARQINVYDLRGLGFGAGMDNRTRSIDPSTPWFSAAIASGGKAVLSGPHADRSLDRYASRNGAAGEKFISLARMLYDRYDIPAGIVEVEQSCDTIFRGLDASGERGDPETFVYASDGSLLFPPSAGSAEDPKGAGGRKLESFARSEAFGWTVRVVADERVLLAPVRRFVATSLLIGLGILLVSLGLAFGVAGRITRPILRLQEELSSIEIGSLLPGPERSRRGSPYEIEYLEESFRSMRSKLKASIDTTMAAREAETHSRLLALQSQMDPHFIYNVIATIGALAEEGLGAEAARLCLDLSDMLRYVSSQKGTDVAAAEELGFTAKYLGCIGVRFGSKLAYSIEADEAFSSLVLPRLLIQPIVENAVKYATTGEPPWRIAVRAAAGDGVWSLVVEDDGPGFSGEAEARVRGRIFDGRADWAPPGASRELQLDGMGLANIAARLRLRYGSAARFDFGNKPAGGAFVAMSGPMEADRAR